MEVKQVPAEAEPVSYESATFQNALSFIRVEQALRIPLDSFMRELCFLEQNVAKLNDVSKHEILERIQIIVGIGKDISALAHSLPKVVTGQNGKHTVKSTFNLQDILKNVYDKVRNEANSTKIALSWYRSPHLGLWYIGEKDSLSSLLYLLLSDSIRATEEGLVSLRVTRDEKSDDYGRLTFIISDTGQGMPPYKRASTVLAKVWELTANHNGELKVESNEEGTTINFTLAFTALEEDAHTAKALPSTEEVLKPESDFKKVLVIAQSTMQRHLFAFQLAKMPCYITEAQNVESGIAQYKNTPCGIVIFDGSLPADDIVHAIATIRAYEGEFSLQPTYFLALTENEKQAELFRTAGCDYTLDQDVRRVTLRAVIEKMLGDAQNPQVPHLVKVENKTKEKREEQEEKQPIPLLKMSPVKEGLPFVEKAKIEQIKPLAESVSRNSQGEVLLTLPSVQDRPGFLTQFFKKKAITESTPLTIQDFDTDKKTISLEKEEKTHIEEMDLTEEMLVSETFLEKFDEKIEKEAQTQEKSINDSFSMDKEEKQSEPAKPLSQLEEMEFRLEELRGAIKNPEFDSIQKMLEDFYIVAMTLEYPKLADKLIEFQDACLIGANLEIQINELEKEVLALG